jgi:hypothetical protein
MPLMRLLTLLSVCFSIALSTFAQEQVSTTVYISGSSFNVESSGSVTYFKTLNCGYIAGKHNIYNGNGTQVVEKAFGPKDGSFFTTSYQGSISGPSAYSNCYRANVEATGECGTSQRSTSSEYCAPPPPPPPPPPPVPDPGPGGCIDNCGGGTFDETGAGGDPLVINLHGPYKLTGLEDPVSFDISASGQPRATGWTARDSDIAFLALDRNGNGQIDDGSELFGNATPLNHGGRAPNGFEGLAQYDANADGIIDVSDPVWSSLLLWVDANHNGISEPSELSRLADSPITAIETQHHWTGRRDQSGNRFGYEGHLHEGHRTQTLYDVFFIH